MPPILETRRLDRDFGALRAVADVSLVVERGELRAIIGPNGAGKTTLFHLLSASWLAGGRCCSRRTSGPAARAAGAGYRAPSRAFRS